MPRGNRRSAVSPSRRPARCRCASERALVGLVDVQAARLAAPCGRGWPSPGRSRRHAALFPPDLELVPLGDGALVGVAGDDQLGAGVDERGRARGRAARPASSRAPRRPDQLVVQRHDAQRAGGAAASCAAARSCPSRTPPDWCRQGRTEFMPTGRRVASVHRLGRLPQALELRHGRVNRAGNVYGMSWFPGTTSTGGPGPRRNAAARSCCSRRPRWVRSPLATTSSGPNRSTSAASAALRLAALAAPICRSETWRIRRWHGRTSL